MPKAEVGSTKYISNKLKSKGLTRLRWYCQVCEKACRDENAFKMHTQSESHVRKMIIIGEDPKKYENKYSQEFLQDFVRQLRTSHGEKQVHINKFYNDFIANKDHIHMNATRWSSLTEFAKYLGREGICRVEDIEGKGIHISWIDNSPEALRRQEALRRKETMDRGDEEREQMIIQEQIRRARHDRAAKEKNDTSIGKQEEMEDHEKDKIRRELRREEGQKISLNLGAPKFATSADPGSERDKTTILSLDYGNQEKQDTEDSVGGPTAETTESGDMKKPPPSQPLATTGFKINAAKPTPKNVFKQAASKKNAFGRGGSESTRATNAEGADKVRPKKPMSEAERIMREEIERKRAREARFGESGVGGAFKKQRRF